jgi:two-component system, cell cycle response regulator
MEELLTPDEAIEYAALAGDRAQVESLLALALERLEPLPFIDPEGAFTPAREAQRIADSFGLTTLHLRAQLVEAEVCCRRGQVAAGGRVAREINRWASENGDRHLLARSHRVLCLFFSYLGDAAVSLEHAVRALEWLEEEPPPRLHFDHLMALSTALAETGSFADAFERLQLSEQLANSIDDPRLQVAVLNAQAWVATDANEHDRALEAAQRMAALAETAGIDLQGPELETLARCQYHAHRYDEAIETLEPVFSGKVVVGEGNSEAYCLLTLAMVQRAQGNLESARASLERCTAVCDERDLASIRVRATEQLAHLYAWEGRYQEAFECYQLFHEAFERLVSSESAARAQMVQAVFETTEARRDSQRFRQMALRDPLTGLYNRRHVDDQLPGLLRGCRDTASPLSIGLVDVDHFKQINDNHSHQVGDAVLRGVAVLLENTLSAPEFVARLGGEEFLLVLPGSGPSEAAACFEKVRRAIRSHRWDSGQRVNHVTVSIGGTTATDGVSPAELLGRADHNLYRAKRAGRDRVVADREPIGAS